MPLNNQQLKMLDRLPQEVHAFLSEQEVVYRIEYAKRNTGAPVYEIISRLILGAVQLADIDKVLEQEYGMSEEHRVIIQNLLNEIDLKKMIRISREALESARVHGLIAQEAQTLLSATAGDISKVVKEMITSQQKCAGLRVAAAGMILANAGEIDRWLMLPDFASLLAGERDRKEQVRLALAQVLVDHCHLLEDEAGMMIEYVVSRM